VAQTTQDSLEASQMFSSQSRITLARVVMAIALACVIIPSSIARADEVWQSLAGGTNGIVYATASYNGELIIGGDFTVAGGVTVNHIARWNGTSWQSLGGGMGTGAGIRVESLLVHNGELIAGGVFLTAGGVATGGVARWNGSTWQAYGTGNAPFANAMAVYNGELIVNGFYTSWPAQRLARWDGTTWQLLPGEINNEVMAMIVYNGELIVTGRFTNVGGMSASGIVRWNGTSWATLGSGLLFGYGYALTIYNSELVVGEASTAPAA